MQIDIEKARKIRSHFFMHPATISIFVVLILLYGWLDAGHTVPNASDTERMLATWGGAALYIGGFYLFLPRLLSANLTASIPFFWKISLLMTCVLVTETVLAYLTIMRGAGLIWLANYFVSSMFIGLAGVLVLCAVFRSQLKKIFDEDPITSIFRPTKPSTMDPLQKLLPQETRGEVLQLEAQTPYLMVTTSNGSALIRMSSKKAMEFSDVDSGWLVHRPR